MKSMPRSGARVLLLPPLALCLLGCLSVKPMTGFASQTPQLAPEVFFAGSAHSWGVLETRSGAPSKTFHVESEGHGEPDGSFRLDQTVTFDGEPSRARSWSLRRIGPHAYTASLTDAAGEVSGEAYGPLFHLRYAMKSPLGGVMEQWMYLQADGRTVLNEATIRVAGLTVARLSERISRDSDAAGGDGR